MLKNLSRLVLIAVFGFSTETDVIAGENGVESNSRIVRQNINVGQVASVNLPAVFKREGSAAKEVVFSAKEDASGPNWSFRSMMFGVCEPIGVNSEIGGKLQHCLLKPGVVQEKDIIPLKPLIKAVETETLAGEVRVIQGKKVLLITSRGTQTGPCQPLPNGGTRRPLFNILNKQILAPLDQGTVQCIYGFAQVMGEAEQCSSILNLSLLSIKWRPAQSLKDTAAQQSAR